jgi:unsaturated rhamnogalacturonyl hydrolase
MKRINYLLFAMVLMCLIKTQGYGQAATYALPEFGGTAVFEEVKQLGGAYLPVRTLTIETDNPSSFLSLKWSKINKKSLSKNPRFRMATASGLRSFQYLEVVLPGGELLGKMDISMTTSFQVFELMIPKTKIEAVLKTGVEVRLKGKGEAISFFTPDKEIPDALCPHLLIPGTLSPQEEFLNRFSTRAGMSNYGWEGGCVLDGLAALAEKYQNPERYKAALDDLLNLYYPQGAELRTYPSIENTSCVAQLAMKDPGNPEIENVLAFWKSRENERGEVVDHKQVAAEGNYTVSWPLAVISKQLNRPELAVKAVDGLRFRTKYLIDEQGNQWLRYRFGMDPLRTYKHWSRGNAWYFLGMAKTMDVLPEVPADLIAEFQRAAKHCVDLQDKEGMWHMFACEPETAPESSGTAGVATALAIGMRNGWIGKEYEKPVQKALKALTNRLTPDGFLTAVAHCNRAEGGEKFQRETKGSILQFGMGFYAQLLAELNDLKK